MTPTASPGTDLNGRIVAALGTDGLVSRRIDSPASAVLLLDEALEARKTGIRRAIDAVGPGGAVQLAAQFASLQPLCDLRHEASERDFRARLRGFSRVPAAINRLRAAGSVDAAVRIAPAEAAAACDLDRVVLFRIDGQHLLAESAFVRGDRAQADDLLRMNRAQPAPLHERILETEIMRRRVAMFVHDAMHHPLTYKPLIELLETASYVAAPIMPAGRVIGFLHGDRGIRRPADPAAVDDIDRDTLWSFAVGLGYALERSELVDRLHAQATHVHDLVVDAEAAVAAYLDVEIELVANRTSGGGSSATTSPREPAGALIGHHAAGAEFVSELSLTRREHEVLELLAAGATNSQIAERLFITEGTAKSHVGRILRKLGAGNRVEAASMFLRSQTQSSPHTRREE